jgi:hypothetical protein
MRFNAPMGERVSNKKSQNEEKLDQLLAEMRSIQKEFEERHEVNDIWSNSKIYEVLIANTLNHTMIPGHSGSLDARDESGREYEYKHFKETSSNHSWTFNDYSDETIRKLKTAVHEVVFSHIQDNTHPPHFDWAFRVPGKVVAGYLDQYTQGMQNARRMINVSAIQIESRLGIKRTAIANVNNTGPYAALLARIFKLSEELEKLVNVENVLTSNKFWEVLVSVPLGHQVNSEQGGRAGAHDAADEAGLDYEYKVSKSRSWNFQDISENVLNKYLNCEEIVLAIVDKQKIEVSEIWFAKPSDVVKVLRDKLTQKKEKFSIEGKELRRLQVSLTAGDLPRTKARRIR